MKCAIEMNRRFLRSVNIGRDRSSKEGLDGYVLTPSVRTALARGLGVEPKLLPVVRKLYAMMRPHSKYARETNVVSDQTRKFRDAFFGARSPEKMLFVDLPVAFGQKPIEGRNGDARQFDEFFNCLNASTSELALALPKLVDEHRRHLLTVCGFEPTSEGWKDLYDKLSFLLARIGGEEIELHNRFLKIGQEYGTSAAEAISGLHRHDVSTNDVVNVGVNDVVNDAVKLSEIETSAIKQILLDAHITAARLSQKLGVKPRQAQRIIASLKEKAGLKRRGADKNGSWYFEALKGS